MPVRHSLDAGALPNLYGATFKRRFNHRDFGCKSLKELVAKLDRLGTLMKGDKMHVVAADELGLLRRKKRYRSGIPVPAVQGGDTEPAESGQIAAAKRARTEAAQATHDEGQAGGETEKKKEEREKKDRRGRRRRRGRRAGGSDQCAKKAAPLRRSDGRSSDSRKAHSRCHSASVSSGRRAAPLNRAMRPSTRPRGAPLLSRQLGAPRRPPPHRPRPRPRRRRARRARRR